MAIKVSVAQFNERFEREAEAIAALNHPNICQIYDVGSNYLVMEYIDGTPIVSANDPRPLPPADALRMATQIAAALVAAHAKGIIHRDLKPANILIAKNGVVKLLDFGLAKQGVDSAPAGDQTQTLGLTQVGTIMGTPAYMSPEQAEGRPVDARSDLFSFGAVFYEMLAGRRPFSGNSAAATLGAIVHKQPDPEHSEIWSALGHAYSISGKKTEARKVLDHLKELSASSYVAPYNIAVIYAGLGEKDQTFAWLERAYKDRGYYLPVYLSTDARLDDLHADARFLNLQRRIGLP